MWIAAAVSLVFCAVLMVRGYLKCPFWDEWWVIAQIAHGESPRSLSWLWSQHNEHRILFPRLLIWLDVAFFGAKNISLSVFAFTVQGAHWVLWIVAVRRWGPVDRSLRWMMQGLFGYCLFCPTQVENFVWAFQFSFLFTFFLATLSFFCVLLLDEAKAPRRLFIVPILAVVLATCTLASGLLVWPFLIALACMQKVGRKRLVALVFIAVVCFLAYFIGYQTPSYHSSVTASLQRPGSLLRYVLTFFGTSWWFLLPHLARAIAFLAIGGSLVLTVVSLRRETPRNKLELLLFVEIGFLLATAFVTALGRVSLGVGQASSSRYQTPAMLFWACFVTLLLFWFRRSGYLGLVNAIRAATVLVVVLSALGMWPIYVANETRARQLRQACQALASDHFKEGVTDRLLSNQEALKQGGEFLRNIWKGQRQAVH
jgi:hypothetical protein